MTRTLSDSLIGLEQCSRHDLARYRAAIDETKRVCWQSYYPFLYFQGQHHSNKLLIGEDAGSICIFRQHFSGGSSKLMLFQLPMPFQPEVLERCLRRTMDHNGTRKVSIFRIDAEDADLFRQRPNTRLATCPDEYIYAPSNYKAMAGGAYANLRLSVNKFQRRDDVTVDDYRLEDRDGCLQVMARWVERQQGKYEDVLFHGYTRTCLLQYERFPRRDLFGKVIRVAGEIRSFGFAGELRTGVGIIFITYSDHGINGLNRYLNYCLMRAMDNLACVNSSNAGDAPGLIHAKQALVPVSLHALFQVYLEANESIAFKPPQSGKNLVPKPSFEDYEGYRSLRLGSEWKMGTLRLDAPEELAFEYTQRMMAFLLFFEPDSMATRHAMQLGLGAGSLTKFCRRRLAMKTTAIELNPAVIDLCRQSFHLPGDDDKLQIILGDARTEVQNSRWHGQIDVLQVDLYDELSDAPLFDDAAFYSDCRKLLSKDGILALNVFGRRANVEESLGRLATAFGGIALWVVPTERSPNTVVLAQYTPSRPSEAEFAARAKHIVSRWGLPALHWLKGVKPWK